MNITVFTIIYNNYGKFLDKWLKNLYKQTVRPSKIIVVLGKNHDVDRFKYKDITFILKDSDNMGTLRV